MQSCGVRRPSVCPSVCKHFAQSLLLAEKMGWIATELAHHAPQTGLHPGCAEGQGPVWVRGHVCYCRINPPRFLAECRKRRLNRVVFFVLLYITLFALFDLYLVFVCLFSCAHLFVSISQVIGCEDRLRNDLCCVGWGVLLTHAQGQGRGQRSRDTGTSVMSRNVCYTVWSHVLSLHALTL